MACSMRMIVAAIGCGSLIFIVLMMNLTVSYQSFRILSSGKIEGIGRAERVGIQPPRARCTRSPQKPNDLARAAVSCNAGLGCLAQCYGLANGFPHTIVATIGN